MLHSEGSPSRYQAIYTHSSRYEARGGFVDLSGPKVVKSHWGKRYTLIMRDDFSRYTWVYFFRHKSDAAGTFKQALESSTEDHGIPPRDKGYGFDFCKGFEIGSDCI